MERHVVARCWDAHWHAGGRAAVQHVFRTTWGAFWAGGGAHLELEAGHERERAPQVGHLVLEEGALDREDAPQHRERVGGRAQERQPAGAKRADDDEAQARDGERAAGVCLRARMGRRGGAAARQRWGCAVIPPGGRLADLGLHGNSSWREAPRMGSEIRDTRYELRDVRARVDRAARAHVAAEAAGKEVAEEGGGEIEAHLLVVEREREGRRRRERPVGEAAVRGPEREAERDAVVLEVAVVDEDEGRQREQLREEAEAPRAARRHARARAQRRRREEDGRVARDHRVAHERARRR
eukprot:2263509-Prymnesium_polylepis.1